MCLGVKLLLKSEEEMSTYKTKQGVIDALDSMYENPTITPLKMNMILNDISDHIVKLETKLASKNKASKIPDKKDKKDAKFLTKKIKKMQNNTPNKVLDVGAIVPLDEEVMKYGILFTHPQLPAFRLLFKLASTSTVIVPNGSILMLGGKA